MMANRVSIYICKLHCKSVTLHIYRALTCVFHIILTTPFCRGDCYCPHFADEETKFQRWQTSLKGHTARKRQTQYLFQSLVDLGPHYDGHVHLLPECRGQSLWQGVIKTLTGITGTTVPTRKPETPPTGSFLFAPAVILLL